jgi:hypothetical protein
MKKRTKVYIIKKRPMGGNYLAICLFGFIFSVRPLSSTELNHESIHAAQQKELLYLPFFIWYGIEWLILYLKYRDWMKAYYHIRFEREAYNHQGDLLYLENRKHFHYQ